MDDDIRLGAGLDFLGAGHAPVRQGADAGGGQMLNLQEPSHLHIMGEVVDRSILCGPPRRMPSMTTTSPNTRSNDNNSVASCCNWRIGMLNGCGRMIPRQVARARQPPPLHHQMGRCRLRPGGPPSTGIRPSRCPVRRSGTWPGAIRMTPSTGRPISSAQPAGGGRHALGRPKGARFGPQPSQGNPETPLAAGIFDGGNPEQGHRRLSPHRASFRSWNRRSQCTVIRKSYPDAVSAGGQ